MLKNSQAIFEDIVEHDQSDLSESTIAHDQPEIGEIFEQGIDSSTRSDYIRQLPGNSRVQRAEIGKGRDLTGSECISKRIGLLQIDQVERGDGESALQSLVNHKHVLRR